MTKEDIYKALCYYLPYDFRGRVGDDNSNYSQKFNGNQLEYIHKNDMYDKFRIIGLRPLSSISIEEMKEAARRFVGGEIFDVHEWGVTMVHHQRGGPDIYPELHIKEFFNLKYGIETFDWIFSKGFDVFGLIDAGIAIK